MTKIILDYFTLVGYRSHYICLSLLILSHLQICLLAAGSVTHIHMVSEALLYRREKLAELRGVPAESERGRQKKMEQFHTSKNKTFDRIDPLLASGPLVV